MKVTRGNKDIRYNYIRDIRVLTALRPQHCVCNGWCRIFYSEGFVVRFYKDDGTSWVGNFAPGWKELNKVFELSNARELLVISGGTCYIMNPNSENPIAAFGMYTDIIECPDKLFVLYNDTEVTVIETGKSIWHSERISFDGIKDVYVENILFMDLPMIL